MGKILTFKTSISKNIYAPVKISDLWNMVYAEKTLGISAMD